MGNPDSDIEISGPDAPDRLTYYPLGQWVDWTLWATYEYQTDSDRKSYEVKVPVRFAFPPYLAKFRTMRGNLWATSHLGWLDLDPKFRFDPSGPALDTQDSAVSSGVHDALCSLGRDENGKSGYPCGYLRAHYLYRRLDQAQGMVAVRSWYQWSALVLCNWVCRLNDKPIPLPPVEEQPSQQWT